MSRGTIKSLPKHRATVLCMPKSLLGDALLAYLGQVNLQIGVSGG